MTTISPWRETEITLSAQQDDSNPYVSQEVWADFIHDNGRMLRRPAFCGQVHPGVEAGEHRSHHVWPS